MDIGLVLALPLVPEIVSIHLDLLIKHFVQSLQRPNQQGYDLNIIPLLADDSHEELRDARIDTLFPEESRREGVCLLGFLRLGNHEVQGVLDVESAARVAIFEGVQMNLLLGTGIVGVSRGLGVEEILAQRVWNNLIRLLLDSKVRFDEGNQREKVEDRFPRHVVLLNVLQIEEHLAQPQIYLHRLIVRTRFLGLVGERKVGQVVVRKPARILV